MAVRALSKWITALCLPTFAHLSATRAQSVEQFYKGKTIHVVIGYGPGGGYDAYGRLAAEFLGRHIPGHPTVVPENMPGGASLRAVEYLATLAPEDGTYLGSVQQELALSTIIQKNMRFDPSKLNYIGRFSSNIDIGVALPRTGITSIEQLRSRQVTIGADQAGSMAVAYAKLLNAYAGMKMKIVTGYTGSAEIQLAAERGEIDVNGSYSLPAVLNSHPGWVKGDGATILYQNALQRFPQLAKTPTLVELVSGDDSKAVAGILASTAEIGRSILTTPGVPSDRLQALRDAFQQMLQDPFFVAACATRRLMIDPAKGEDMDAIRAQISKVSPTTIEAVEMLFKN